MLKGAGEIGGCQRIIDDKGHAGLTGNAGNGLNVTDNAAGIGEGFNEDRLGAGGDGRFKRAQIIRIGPFGRPAKVLIGMVELVDRAAIELS